MKKKGLVSVLLTLLCALLLFAFVGCTKADFKAEFKENTRTDILVGSSIDVEDYLVPVANTERTVTFTYYNKEKGTTETATVGAATFYMNYSGEYTMTYTLTRGRASSSAQMKFNVYGNPPTVSSSGNAIIYRQGVNTLIEAIVENANLKIDPVNATLTAKKVSYYRETLTLEKTIDETTAYEKDLTGEEKFKFTDVGTYVFTVEAESEHGKTQHDFRVEVVPTTVESTDVYVDGSGKAIFNNAEASGNTVRLVQAADMSNASYFVVDGTYKENDIFRVEFKGRNCPQIGLLTSPDLTAGNPYGMYAGKGYIFSFEHSYTDKFSIWGGSKLTGRNNHNGNATWGYFGYENFDPTKYYSLELYLKSDSAAAAKNQGSLTLWLNEIENYGTGEENYKSVYRASVGWHNDTSALSEGQIVFYSSRKDNVVFKYYKPVSDVDENSFTYDKETKTVSWDAVEGANYLVSTDNQNFTWQTDNSYTVEDFYGNTTLYVKSTVGTNDLGASVSYGVTVLPNYMADMNVSMARGVINTDKSVTLAQGTQKGVAYAISNASVPYFAFDGEYGVGDYVAFEFAGRNNFPQLVFFANDYGTDITNGKGIYLDNNLYHERAAVLRNRFTAFGPNMISTGSTTDSSCRYDPFFRVDAAEEWQSAEGLCYNSLSDTVNYRYLIGFEQQDITKIILRIALFNADTGALIANKWLPIAHGLTSLTGSIVAYGNFNNEVTFKYYVPNDKAQKDLLLSLNDKTLSWTAVENAKYYIVTENSVIEPTTNSYTFTGNTYYERIRIIAVSETGVTQSNLLEKVDLGSYAKSEKTVMSYSADGAKVTATMPSGYPSDYSTNMSYFYTKENYSAGSNYVRLDFVGLNYPGKVLFGVTNEPSATLSEIHGFGLNIELGGAGAGYFLNNAGVGSMVNAYINQGSTNLYAYMINKPTTKFVLIAGTKVNDLGDKLILEYWLYEETTTGTLTLVDSNTYTRSNTLQQQTGKIVVTSSVKYNKPATVTMSAPNTYANILAGLKAEYTIAEA